ncbi:aldehyde dehydrogenase family protein [Hyphococcus luteus]|uniref:Aldehyde dehydrogenase n=1 Tax=Hyphococcus luteus TaxID=2058213 RepID=A0A2S7K1L7_9PROT|nr:aldehyde dehydrogenase family protein [Marinicaulis flavus]PQA86405.1 aldehyde dehydrogenase [Marinicaulis flavus]
MAEFKLVIGGRAVRGDREIDVVNPATEDIIARCPAASAAQLDEAVAAAKSAFPPWAQTPVEKREALMREAAAAIRARLDELSRVLTAEQGKPLNLARMEISRACDALDYFAQQRMPRRIFRETQSELIYEQRKPLGVVAAITPWNFPVILLTNKLGPALITGNCVVAKPAPTTPLTTLRIGEICADILPSGVFNVICDDNDLGAALTGHPDVAKISFTGSTATGRKVFASAAPDLKRVTLELGGNDAALILDDADLEEAIPQIYRSAMTNSGQVCMAIKRVYAPEALYDEVCERLSEAAQSSTVGNGADPGVDMGPVQNAAQFRKLKALLGDCDKQGKLTQGETPRSNRGYFIPPTIVKDIPDNAPVVQEEQFGPVLPVLQYADLEDALARINDSIFGLGASVWSRDIARAVKLGERIDSGTVWINRHQSVDPSVPFRGARQSGMGAELGEAGMWEFTQAQVVNIMKEAAFQRRPSSSVS